jgi:hypothetical protein
MGYPIVVVVLFLILAGCSPMDTGSNELSYPNNEPVASSVVDINEITPLVNENGENVVIPPPGARQSKAKLIHDISLDVSKRFGVDIGDVALIEIEEIVWTDGALGCPAPDVKYSQEPVSGFRVVVKLHTTEYTYHTKGFETFIWCNGGIPVVPVN